MRVYIMRHGEACLNAPQDSLRTLTAQGREQTLQMANWLISEDRHIERALVSPYVRAEQTFDVLNQVLKIQQRETLNELTPGGRPEIVANHLYDLRQQQVSSILLVSHFPLVGYLVDELCQSREMHMFSTSSIVCLTLDSQLNGQFEWHRSPKF